MGTTVDGNAPSVERGDAGLVRADLWRAGSTVVFRERRGTWRASHERDGCAAIDGRGFVKDGGVGNQSGAGDGSRSGNVSSSGADGTADVGGGKCGRHGHAPGTDLCGGKWGSFRCGLAAGLPGGVEGAERR